MEENAVFNNLEIQANLKDSFHLIIFQFEKFLRKKLRSSNSINDNLRSVKQYIEWYISENINVSLFADRERIQKYKLYLKEEKKYKDSTIKRKMESLIKLNEFLKSFNPRNCKKMILDECEHLYIKIPKSRSQYNYKTRTFIKL